MATRFLKEICKKTAGGLRLSAARELSDLEPVYAFDVLIRELPSCEPHERLRVIKILGIFPYERFSLDRSGLPGRKVRRPLARLTAIAKLRPLLRDERTEVRAAAARALAKLAPPLGAGGGLNTPDPDDSDPNGSLTLTTNASPGDLSPSAE